MEKKTPWQKTFDPNYLGSWSLEEREELAATVTKVEQVEMIGSTGLKHSRIVLHLDKAPANGLLLPLVVGNKENAKAMEKISGSRYIEDWAGSRITIYVKKNVKSFGELVDALRIKPAGAAKKRSLKPEEFDRMLTAIQEGKITTQEALDRYSLTAEQSAKL